MLVFGQGLVGFGHGLEHPSTRHGGGHQAFQALVAELQGLADQDRTAGRWRWAERVRVLEAGGTRGRRWLAELAGLDARGAAGAEQGVQVRSTAGWLAIAAMSAGAARQLVRTAGALYRGPLTGAPGCGRWELSVRPCPGAGRATQDLPDHVTAEAEPVLVEAAPAGPLRLPGHHPPAPGGRPDGADR